MRRWCWALGLLALTGCKRDGPPVTGHRVDPKPPVISAVNGLAFPLDPPAVTALTAVHSYPALRFERPLFLTHAPGDAGHVFVVEQGGRILVFEDRDDVSQADVYLDLRDRVRTRHNEEGLLGLAFAPDYASTGVFYVYYSASSPRRAQISRFRAKPEQRVADPTSEEPLLDVAQPYGNHNGGTVAFGPDGMLYAGFGDGGAAGDPERAGQDLAMLLGSIVRLEVSSEGPYAIPKDNPFVGTAGAREEIYAYGLRNPWRFSFDRQTGELWVGDVGQDALEEIDRVVSGGNYGWSVREGDQAYASGREQVGTPIDPLITYGRRDGQSITGGYVYRGTHLPAFRGAYFYGDYASGTVWASSIDGDRVVSNEVVTRVPSLASFGENAAGELFAVSLEGRVYRFEPTQRDGTAPAFPTRLSQTGLFSDLASLTPKQGLLPYAPTWPFWSDGATKQRWIALPEGGSVAFDREEAWGFPVGTVTVKHFELPLDDEGHTRRLETRVMVHESRGWAGYTYRWNDAQTDAELVTTPQTARYTVSRGGSERTQEWTYPAGSDCLRCHNPAVGEVLGVRTRQLSHGGESSVIAKWAAAGMFVDPPSSIVELPSHPAVDEDASAEARARAYLDVNCALCHRPRGPAPGSMDLRAVAPLGAMNLVDVASEESLGLADERRVAPGEPKRSSLWARMTRLDRERMPPLASSEVDHEGAAVLAAWIESLQ